MGDNGTWTEEWPTEPGLYWFCGWDFGDTSEKYIIGLCDVWKTANSLAFVLNGNFLYKSEAIGVWQPATLPEPPETVGGLTLDMD